MEQNNKKEESTGNHKNFLAKVKENTEATNVMSPPL